MCMKDAAEAYFERKCFLCRKQGLYSWADLRGWRPQTPSLHCVYVCVLFLQTVIVIPLAQTLIAVMAQDIVNVRRERQGLSAMSVYKDICGTMAANVSRTSNQPAASVPCSLFFSLSLSTPPFSLLPSPFSPSIFSVCCCFFGLPRNEQLGLLTALGNKKILDWLPSEAQSHLLYCLVSGLTTDLILRELLSELFLLIVLIQIELFSSTEINHANKSWHNPMHVHLCRWTQTAELIFEVSRTFDACTVFSGCLLLWPHYDGWFSLLAPSVAVWNDL